MKKKFLKKLLSLVLAGVMFTGFSFTTYAEPTQEELLQQYYEALAKQNNSGKKTKSTAAGFKGFAENFVGAPISTGNTYLDKCARDFINSVSTPGMNNYQKLLAVYDTFTLYGVKDYYARDYYTFSSELYSSGIVCQDVTDAVGFLFTLQGDCYNFSGAFMAVARQLGFNAYCVRGVCSCSKQKNPTGYTNHEWCVINTGTAEYVFDPNIECSISKGKTNNHVRFAKTYSQLVGKYKQYSYDVMVRNFGDPSWNPFLHYGQTTCEIYM